VKDDDLPPLPVDPPAVDWDRRVSLPVRWVETGQFGTLRIPCEDYGQWDKQHEVDGHWYRWNGLFLESAGNAQQPRIIYPDGTRGVSSVKGWRPGSPPLTKIRDEYGNVYEYDQTQGAYIYRRTAGAWSPKEAPTVLGSLALSIWWSWFPSLFVGWAVTALLLGPHGANSGNASVPGVLVSMLGCWWLVHRIRGRGATRSG
jgi:hypothetical protein